MESQDIDTAPNENAVENYLAEFFSTAEDKESENEFVSTLQKI